MQQGGGGLIQWRTQKLYHVPISVWQKHLYLLHLSTSIHYFVFVFKKHHHFHSQFSWAVFRWWLWSPITEDQTKHWKLCTITPPHSAASFTQLTSIKDAERQIAEAGYCNCVKIVWPFLECLFQQICSASDWVSADWIKNSRNRVSRAASLQCSNGELTFQTKKPIYGLKNNTKSIWTIRIKPYLKRRFLDFFQFTS